MRRPTPAATKSVVGLTASADAELRERHARDRTTNMLLREQLLGTQAKVSEMLQRG